MGDSTTVNIEIPAELADKVESVAEATRRSKAACVAEAIQDFVERESSRIETIEEGIRQAEKDRFVDHQKVVDWVESWDTENEKERPRCD
jgi:predicted transcriptional regulator